MAVEVFHDQVSTKESARRGDRTQVLLHAKRRLPIELPHPAIKSGRGHLLELKRYMYSSYLRLIVSVRYKNWNSTRDIIHCCKLA